MASSNRSSGQFDSSGSPSHLYNISDNSSIRQRESPGISEQLLRQNNNDSDNTTQPFNISQSGTFSRPLEGSGSCEQIFIPGNQPGSGGSYNSGSDSGYHFVQPNEGYDLDFLDPKDDKYTCPICLLVLREPLQTECGHRFCRVCISRWLRDSEGRCPVDNERLQEHQLFPDNFAKREILSLKVKCPNVKEGCDSIFILKQLGKHFEQCNYVSIPCPNKCTDILLRKDLDQHLTKLCQKRLVPCPQCHVDILAVDFKTHEDICPLAMVNCHFCGYSLMREQLARHVDHDCPKAIVCCDFMAVGCNEKVERNEMARHMNESTQVHLRLMLSSLLSFFNFFGVNPRTILERQSHQQTQSLPTQTLPTQFNFSGFTGQNAQSFNSLMAELNISGFPGGAFMQNIPRAPAPEPNHPALHRNMSQELSGTSSGKRNLDRTVSKQTQAGSELSYTSKPSGEGDKLAQGVPDNEFQSLKIQFASQDESLARHEHFIAEFKQRNEYLESANRELKTKLRNLESIVTNFEGRSCNGLYVWKVTNYAIKRREAEIGDNTAIHSPPFYSSCYGYRLCLRANLNGVDTARGTHLSVFIHFMQGEFDDVLEWPFSGRIILTVIDQNPVCELRHHVVETLLAKPNLAAFQRPVTPRNHKGFGYMEFLPLGILDNSTYIRNDTLIIKAHVIPTG